MMKYFAFVWAGLWRNRTRTVLTSLSIIASFLLIGSLQILTVGIDRAIAELRTDRLLVSAKYIRTDQLPIRFQAQLEQLDGVRAVSHRSTFGGYLGEPKNRLDVTVTSPTLFTIMPELKLPPSQLDAFVRTRTGVVIGRDLANEKGWGLGSHFMVTSRLWMRKDGSYSWPMDVVGIYDAPYANLNREIYLRFDYFDEARIHNKGRVDRFVVSVTDSRKASAVAYAIDETFTNSVKETATFSEQELATAQLRRAGNIQWIVNGIVGAVLFTLLYLTGNVIMLSFRERGAELATLKAIGFTDVQVLGIVCMESVLLTLGAALLGLAASALLLASLTQFLGPVRISLPPLLAGIGMAILLALAAAGIPAWQARKLTVAAALARQ